MFGGAQLSSRQRILIRWNGARVKSIVVNVVVAALFVGALISIVASIVGFTIMIWLLMVLSCLSTFVVHCVFVSVSLCALFFCVRRFLHGGILMENNSLRPTHRRHWINAKRVDDDGDNGDDDVDDEVDEFAFACAYAFYAVFAKVMAIPMGACPDTLHCARHVLSYPMHINARVDDDSSDGNDGDDDYDGVDDDVGRR